MYYCDICDYKTDYSSNFSIHKKSKKHINYSNKKVNHEPINIAKNSIDVAYSTSNVPFTSNECYITCYNKLYCQNCNKNFKHTSSLYRHKKNCNKSVLNNDKDKEIENIKKEMSNMELKYKLELLEKEKELYKKMEQEKSELLTNFMNNANILLNKTTDNNKITTQAMQNVSMSALKYANDKFKDTPVLIPLDNFNINELSFENAEEKGQLTEILIYNAKQNSLDKLLGDHIIKYYKKENPENQSFHSTDCSRLNYIVRELIENTPTWIVDKNGIKICKDIMKPLIKKCINALLDYQKELLQKMGNGNYNKQKEVELIIDIIMSIDSGNLENDINKYIAPFFNLNKS